MTGKSGGAFRAHRDTIMPHRVRAVLGPTNTGKTYYALERMLAHASGIIAFPLRLLARENYERMVSLKGPRAVALITGEEKIVPPGARWIACTTEAMPMDRHAEFIAIDEIQLCADPDRGHIFTDRLLNARGQVETLFLGAETIRPVLQRLVPDIEIETRPRLSQLMGVGHTKLSRLPPRSAIVAFSAAEVYAIAEAVRQRRGGCAIVMGRLSPRTRNAQVQLYQNKEVDYLVATDAIGMGLNMDVNHVALASLTKFDGTTLRRLQSQEIAQIAGRAGRGTRDGTFGTTGEARPMNDAAVEAIETHRFDPIQRLHWRNGALDFSSPTALLTSLNKAPPNKLLTAGRAAGDVLTLEALSTETQVMAAAQGTRRTKLLWDVCQIPDFRKLGDDTHARLCQRLFFDLLENGAIPTSWLDRHIANCARTEGDIDTLMQRLTGVRIAAYIAARADWTPDAPHWQERARTVEDHLSDALHERLTARFVDRRATSLLRRLDSDEDSTLLSAVTQEGDVIVEGHAIGRMNGFALSTGLTSSAPEQRLMLRAGRRALAQEIPRRVEALVTAPDEAFALDMTTGLLSWQGASVARLSPGPATLKPEVQILRGEFQDARQRERLRERLRHYAHGQIASLLAPLFAAQTAATSPGARGIVHRLMEAGGATAAATEDHGISKETRAQLKRLGIIVGARTIFMSALLKPAPMALRALLIATHRATRLPVTPDPQRTALTRTALAKTALAKNAAAPVADTRFLSDLGWCSAGGYLIRADAADRLMTDIRRLTYRRDHAADPRLLSRLGIPANDLSVVMKGLGIRHRPPAHLPPDVAGPPTPFIFLRSRPQRQARQTARTATAGRPIASDSPFAVLDGLRSRLQQA